MKNRIVKVIAAFLMAALFAINAQALTYEVTQNTGNAYMERPCGSYLQLADDIIDNPALTTWSPYQSPYFKYYGGQWNLALVIDTTVSKGTHLVGYLSSDGISYDEAIYVVVD